MCSVCFCSLLQRLTLLLSFLDILHCLPHAVGVPLESALNLVSPMSPCGAHDTHLAGMSLQNLSYCKHCLALSGHGGKTINASDPQRGDSVAPVLVQGKSFCLVQRNHGGKGIKAPDPNRHTSVVLVELQGNSLCLAISSPNGKEIPPKDASVMPVRY